MTLRVLVPSGALGLGFDEAALKRGLAREPHIIAIDGGSTDSGPYYLGTGRAKYARAQIAQEWACLMEARAAAGVPLLVGSAGTCGTDGSVDELFDITETIARERGERLRVALLKSGQEPEAMADAFERGVISALPSAPKVEAETFRQCSHIVALAGAEAIQSALQTGAEIVIAGRASDAAVIAALPLLHGCDPGASWHGAKVGECGALATTDPSSGSILLTFGDDDFTLTALGDRARATGQSVSAHMLYENSDPFILHEPGGHLDVSGATYRECDAKTVRVRGARWVPTLPYTVKLEGARCTGFQSVSLTLLRDPLYVARSELWCGSILAACKPKIEGAFGKETLVEMRVIGRNATLGALEPMAHSAHEVGVLTIVTAPSQAVANEASRLLNPYLLHHALGENEPAPTFAFPFSPPEMERGPVFEFCLHHCLCLDKPMDAFRLDVTEVGT